MPKKKQNSDLNKDIKGIILITLGILIIISIFSSSSGVLGDFSKKLIFALMGIGAYVFPIFIIYIGFRFITNKGKISFGRNFYILLMAFINTLMIIQRLNSYRYSVNDEVILGISNIFNASSVVHGGILCYLLDTVMYKLLGNIGCYVVYFSVYIVSFVLMFDISLGNIIKEFKQSIDDKKSKDRILEEEIVEEIVEERHTPNSKLLEACDIDKEQNAKPMNSRIKIIDFIKSENDNKSDLEENKSENDEIEKQISERSVIASIEYEFPKIDFLNQNTLSKLNREDKKELISNANKLEDTLGSFGVEAKVLQVTKGPSVTRFELQPNAGVKVSKIVNLADDIALNLAAPGVRIEAPIPGKSAVGIEVPNRELTPVYLREVVESDEFTNSNKNLAFALGKDIGGKCVVADLSKMPHVLIAGATGSGKSVCINTLIISILYKYSPQNVKLLMIDPKVVELSVYNGIPHLLVPVVTDPKKAAGALNWAVNEMSRRYKMFAENNVRNIESYNDLFSKGKINSKLHWIVIIIDELADLMMVCPNDIEDYIGRLAQMARAAGMHLVIATQRPSVDVITGVIKANIPSRISFAVSSQIDSRTILDTAGAEKLLGKGDMLFYPVGESKPLRIQGAFISEEEVEKVVEFIKQDKGEPEYHDEILEEINTKTSSEVPQEFDELLDEAIRIVIEAGQASTSLIQRRLRIGYNRAARIIEQMEEKGIISPKDGSRPREIIISKDSNEYRKYYQGNI